MRIAHILSSLKRGGAETVLASLLNHPVFDNDEHHIIYFHDGPITQQLNKKNIHLYHIPYSPLFAFRFIYTLFTIGPDCIHALLWFAMVCSAISGFLLRIPVVVVFHNNIEQNSAYKNYIDRLSLRLVRHYVAVAGTVADQVCNYHTWLNRSNIQIIHNGIDLPTIIPRPSRADYAIPQSAIVIATVGRFEEVKRYPWLIDRFAELCKKHANLYLLLIGTGSQEQALRSYVHAKRIGPNVRFIVNQNAYPLYPLCDIFTLTSKKEGLPIALLEAMSYGKSIIVTHEGSAHPVILDGHDGLLIAADNAAMFCSQMERLINDQSLRSFLGENGLKSVSARFSRDTMVLQYKTIFTNLLFAP